jgi:hypothetical protein
MHAFAMHPSRRTTNTKQCKKSRHPRPDIDIDIPHHHHHHHQTSDIRHPNQGKKMQSTNEEEQHIPDPSLLEAYHYINSVPGKDVRGKLIDCFQLWLQLESSDVLTAIKV